MKDSQKPLVYADLQAFAEQIIGAFESELSDVKTDITDERGHSYEMLRWE